ncbi:serine/threonine-protein kinase, partial [uncultured Jatrophihabitans sp.]|uniref:serine/threonine-protein kinase n=1 Tax=uncultured Jatrophihabitans sp. TaxID=1610747 RepID=UPI0035CB7AFF
MAQTFGRYELREVLGRGGMGEVYRARDTVRQRDVALKVLPDHLAGDEKFLARFRRESRLAAQLSDPHIIPIHDFGEIDGRLFIDMRLVLGSDLGSLIEDRGPLTVPVAVDILGQVASALDAAHADALIHRDVKPGNVMLTGLTDDLEQRPPFAYLVDFGIARSTTQMTALTDTSSATIGTVAYMSPERINGDVGDGRGDVYALACVLFEVLTGEPPFVGDLVPMIYQHMNADPPRVSERVDVPPALDAVIAQGLAKDPDERFATAGALALAARRALSDHPTTPVSSGSTPPVSDGGG